MGYQYLGGHHNNTIHTNSSIGTVSLENVERFQYLRICKVTKKLFLTELGGSLPPLYQPDIGVLWNFEIEKFYPGPGIEPGPLALRASALTITPSKTTADPR